jgi:hypothetical protein
MRFVPENLPDENLGEVEVWEQLKKTFRDEDGVAYHRFPIYRTGGLYGHEADIVLIFRDVGIFVVEVKGCRANNIERIEGHHWHMRNWTQELETPVKQARDQMFALKDWIDELSGLQNELRFYHVVALPFVDRAEWNERGFNQASIEEAVLLADDLSPTALREWIQTALGSDSQSLTDHQWAMVNEHIGHTPDSTIDSQEPSLYFYEERVPDAETVQGLMEGEAPNYTYVTATTALEGRRWRDGFRPSHQIEEDEDGPKPQFTFPKMMRHLMGASLFTRVDERVLLWKAAREIAASDPDKERRLKHDVFAWRDAISWLEERGYDLSEDDLPEELAEQIVHPEVRDLLEELQAAYRQKQEEKNPSKSVFEVEAHRFLNEEFRPTEYVILEGFSHFTPLQKEFIDRCAETGAKVILIFPYRKEQDRAFQAIQSTFEDYGGKEKGNLYRLETSDFDDSRTDLHHVRRNLFADDPEILDSSERDGSVSVTAYDHVNTEAATTVAQAIEYVDEGDLSPNDVAIVTRDRPEVVPLLLEEAERQNRPDLFHIRPRELLLTPVGRFALTLYKVWDDEGEGRLDMNPDQFEALIASGWLGASTQATARDFEKVKAQIFDRCSALSEWKTNLDRLEALSNSLPETSRQPAASADGNDVLKWRRALSTIETICRNLFEGDEEHTVGQHIQRLLDELTRISEREFFERERKVIERIRDELLEVQDSDSIEMETTEFGDVLNSLVREREQSEGEGEENPERITVTGPFGIDRAEKEVVFMIGMSGGRMPGTPASEWPVYRFNRDDHYDQQRYLFLSGVRAAQRRLHVSYAKVADARKKQPSPFVRDVAKILGREEFNTDVRVDAGPAETDKEMRDLGEAQRNQYTLDEIAHFALCPHRYKMERISDDARRYEPMWQIRFLAQGHWIHKVLECARHQEESLRGEDEIEDYLMSLMDHVEEEVKADFPGLRDLDWRSVQYHTRRSLCNFPWQDYDTTFHVADDVLSETQDFDFEVIDGNRRYEVEVSIPHAVLKEKYPWPFLDADTNREWLIPAQEPEREDSDEEWLEIIRSAGEENTIGIYRRSVQGVPVFASKYDAVQWWSWAKEAAFFRVTTEEQDGTFAEKWQESFRRLAVNQDGRPHITQIVEAMEAGRYPKNPGDHCHFCPLKSECMGLEP